VSLVILLEAMKIHKLRHEKTVQLWFVLLYVINLLPLVLPVGDKDFTPLLGAFAEMSAGRFDVPPVGDLLTPGNWLIIGLLLLTNLITLFFSLMYVTLFVGEKDDRTPRQAVLGCFRALPSLLALGLLLLLPALFSALLAFIPLVVFLLMIYFLPLNLTLERKNLAMALQDSLTATRHRKLFIFFKVVLLSFVLSLPQRLVQSMVTSVLAYYALSTFFLVLQSFMHARLMGILYLYLVKKVPFVIPSKPDTAA